MKAYCCSYLLVSGLCFNLDLRCSRFDKDVMDGGKEFQNDTAEYLIKFCTIVSEKYGIRSLLSWQVSWL